VACRTTVSCLLAAAVLAACTRADDAAAATQAAAETANRARVDSLVKAGGQVDSILPITEHLRRFRATLAEQPDTLRHAAPSREAVAARWLAAMTARDTQALRHLALDRAEFAYLYYPGTALSEPPYSMPAELLWSQMYMSSEDGARAALRTLAGRRATMVSFRCPESPRREGANSLHQNCLVVLRVDGRTLPETRVFGTIIERDGRFKLVGLSSKL
jgi:hypothetical protein